MARLQALHGEAGDTLVLAQLLGRAPQACVVLMLAAPLALIWTGTTGGTGLKAGFAWSALLILGLVAMIRLHIRGFARSLRRTPLNEAAADLRLLLLYTGAAWGGGAFLIMPELPAPAFTYLFAVLPGLGVALALRDGRASLAFLAPAVLLTAAAALIGAWPMDSAVAAAILASGSAIILGSFWRIFWGQSGRGLIFR